MKTIIGVDIKHKKFRVTNKDYEQAIAQRMPEKCDCGWSQNFELGYTETGIGEKVTARCPSCTKVFDITPYEYW